MKKNLRNITIALVFFLIALIFTILAKKVDVANVGEKNTALGFSSFNLSFNKKYPYNGAFYDFSKYLGLLPLILAFGYACMGFYQLIKYKKLGKVYFNLYMLAIIYLLIIIFYILFDKVIIINYRPLLGAYGKLEPSFPSTHSMYSVALCGTGILINHFLYSKEKLINSKLFYIIFQLIIFVTAIVVVFFRAISGVHWITDIIGGILYGLFFVALYYALINLELPKKNEEIK